MSDEVQTSRVTDSLPRYTVGDIYSLSVRRTRQVSEARGDVSTCASLSPRNAVPRRLLESDGPQSLGGD